MGEVSRNMSSVFTYPSPPDVEAADSNPLGRLLVALFVILIPLLYLVRLWALPKPIPGIPFRHEASDRILGDIPDLLRAMKDPEHTYMHWIEQQMRELDTPIMQLFMRPFSKPVLVLADFREAQDVLMRRREWDRSDMLRDLFGGLIPGHHARERTNEVWKSHRRLLQDLMSPPFLNNVAGPAVYANALDLIRLWDVKAGIAQGRPFSAHDDIYKAALDAVQAFAFGSDFEYNATRPNVDVLEALDGDQVRALLGDGDDDDAPVEFPEAKPHEVVTATLQLAESVEKVQGWPSMSLAWKLLRLTPSHRRAERIKDAYIVTELRRAVEDRLQLSGAHDDTTHEPRSASQDMISETFGFVITGHDTTSTTVLWALKRLADNPLPQARLRSALRDAFPKAILERRNPRVQEVTGTSIPYLDAFMEEVLRVAGTNAAVDRQATTDTQLLGFAVPKNTIMLILTQGYKVSRDAFRIEEGRRSPSSQAALGTGRVRGEWDAEDVASFKPERWLVSSPSPSPGRVEGGEEGPSGAGAEAEAGVSFNPEAGPQLAFGLGMRACYGRRLAYLELRIMLTLIVWNFELLPCPDRLSKYSARIGVTTKPKSCYTYSAHDTFTIIHLCPELQHNLADQLELVMDQAMRDPISGTPADNILSALPRRQRAVVQDAAGRPLVVDDAPVPAPRPDSILVKTTAAAINPCDYKLGALSPRQEAIVGTDFVGAIVWIGHDAALLRPDLRRGDIVCGLVHGSNPDGPDNGAMAQYLRAHPRLVYKVPDGMVPAEAATLGVALATSMLSLWDALELEGTPDAPLNHDDAGQAPEHVLVYGASTAMGTMALQLLKMSGYTPIATCSAKNFDLVKSYGAAYAFEYADEDAAIDAIRQTTGANRPKYALDCIADGFSVKCCFGVMARTGGRYVCLEQLPESLRPRRRSVKQDFVFALDVFGLPIKAYKGYERDPGTAKHEFAVRWCRVFQELLDQGKLRPHPVQLLGHGFEGFTTGLGLLRSGSVSGKKLVVYI
ncbi:Cytochrome P450 monooxygenase TRI13 [Colletotrichum orbiculare MAFF 240422]|uniref:Cytochrome P450 monooxygenase TRI13 n=1 Tax=Colletotrichum orbiculare (strain 104-T / ATCC 96160 / CBS 514.97 / LARS 414 / MAFF 240422) TaxID=1213857 RepID=N4V1G7_COLOR|nr:Cytochrome P450 monooxygenase TRI13 [Colletotrichum orbiculare MAFF 240422]